MKKAISVFLVTLFMYTSCGFYFLQLENLSQCSMLPALKNNFSNLITLSLCSNAYERVGDDEIIYQGKMYDIVKEVEKSGNTVFYVIPDQQEDNILTSIKTHFETNNGNGPKNSVPEKNNVKSIDKDFYSTNVFIGPQSGLTTRKTIIINQPLTGSPFVQCFSPPPWIS